MRNNRLIAQHKLESAKVYTDRWYWVTTLPKNISVMEVGVAAGDFSQHIVDHINPSRLVLLDSFEQDDIQLANANRLKRYSYGENFKFVENRFRAYGYVELVEGNTLNTLPKLAEDSNNKFDMIYLDAGHKYENISSDLFYASQMVKTNGTLAINDYMAWDENNDRYDVIYAVNEFLDKNQDWIVSGIALERSMYADIYLTKRAFGQD
jgi:predicted O-methyltransferase YrrM